MNRCSVNSLADGFSLFPLLIGFQVLHAYVMNDASVVFLLSGGRSAILIGPVLVQV